MAASRLPKSSTQGTEIFHGSFTERGDSGLLLRAITSVATEQTMSFFLAIAN